MKKLVFWGTALVMLAMLVFSCNKNRFDFDHFESAQGSGQWKLPVASARISLDTVLNQLMAKNDLVSADANGQVQICYGFPASNLINGASMLNLGSVNPKPQTTVFNNATPGVPQFDFDTIFSFSQVINLSADSASIQTAVIKSGQLVLTLGGSLEQYVVDIQMSTPDIIMPGGVPLSTTEREVDLAGASFNMIDPVTNEADSTILFEYAVHCHFTNFDQPEYDLITTIAFIKLKLQQLSGYIDSYVYEYSYDSTFNMPLNLEGQMTLLGAKMRVEEKNTFGGLKARLSFKRAEFYGGETTPAPIFSEFPLNLNVVESPTYINIVPEDKTVDLTFNSKFDKFGMDMVFDLNPSHDHQLIHIYDTSNLGLKFNAVIPMNFKSDGIYYLDTLDLNIPSVDVTKILNEIRLTMDFESEMPFNLDAEFLTLDPETGAVTDHLMTTPMHIEGSFNGQPVHSQAVISITQDRLTHFLQANKLAMRFGIDTKNKPAEMVLGKGLGMGVTLKADIIYGAND